MGLILTLVLGGFAGYLASLLVNRDQSMGILANIVVGIIGAFLANVFLAPLLGVSAVLSTVTLGGFLMAVLGAVLLLVIVNLFTRRSIR